MLEGVGLVSKQHFIGYCTAPTLNRKQFDELYEIRLLIEPFAARRAATRMGDAEFQELAALARQMEPGVTRASYDLFADQDAEFHERLAVGSGNMLIAEALKRLHSHMHIFRLRFHSQITTEAFDEHAEVIDALQRRNPAEAEATMRAHIEKSYNRLAQFANG